jgi:dual specificity tyrosine-phosphorylation-regulated kinase 2/3/4
LSSVGSVRTPAQIINPTKTPDRAAHSSRPGTAGSSASTNLAPATLAAPILSPTSSVRRNHSKRLTPSSIPFFRRSSSQSMQIPPANGALSSTSPTYQSMISTNQLRPKQTNSPSQDLSSISTSTPGTTHKKSSILGGLPSLLKSSSRRSLHADAKDAAKEIAKELQRAKEAARESEKERQKQEKERQKKEDKDRSESRISVIINRKRGKVSL